jgi:membrane fusion protein (multidrug efflux system)
LSLSGILVLAACSHSPKAPAPKTVDVGVVALTPRPVTTSTELSGRTTATLASDVRPQIDGIIEARLFTEGAIVHAGQALYRVDQRPYRAALSQAAANVESAQATYIAAKAQADRYKTLSDVEAVSKQQIDNAVASAGTALAAVHQAQAALQAARINLNYTIIKAPISGRIGRSAVTPGALVTASQTTALATIQRLDPIYVDLTQSSDELIALRQSLASGAVLPATTSVRLTLQSGTAYPQPGIIKFAEVVVNPDSNTVALRAEFPNPSGMLLPGMFVRVTTPQAVVPDGILASQQGVTRDPRGNATALVVGTDGKVAQRNLTVGDTIGNAWLVRSGFKPGDRLIVQGSDKVQAGDAVRAVPITLPKKN